MNLILVTIIFSFLSNLVWENLHSKLYSFHLHQKITEKTLLVASLGDVVLLTLFALLWYYVPIFKNNIWFVVPLGLFIAFVIEKYALATERWSYNVNMPIVPYLNVGLSPFVQLAVTGFLLLLILSKLR